jgi:hypothetical protein
VKDVSTRSEDQSPSEPSRAGVWGAIFVSAGFLLLGICLIPLPGIYPDEVIFSDPLYLFSAKEFTIGLFHRRVTLMLLSYLGTLKTLIYIPILGLFHSNVWSLRLPMVLIGAITIFLFFVLARRSAGASMALAAAILLATDASFLLTNTVDWGPVALEHFLLVTGCFFILKFAQQGGRVRLILGFFLFGVAFWNKAIFVWAFAGVSVAAIVMFWNEIRRLLRPATAAIACLGLLAGALPLIVYNLHSRQSRTRENIHFDTTHFREKFGALERTLDGSALFGFMSRFPDAPLPKPAANAGTAVWIATHAREPRADWMVYAFAFALLLIPWWWRNRAAWFSLIAGATAWIAMAVTKEAGSAAHHSVLLWPFPQLFIAIALFSIPWRGVAIGVAAILAATNLLVVNEYIADFERYGSRPNFSDAVFAMSREFDGRWDDPVIATDWGIVNQLSFLHQGKIKLVSGDPPFFNDPPSPGDQRSIDWMFSTEGAVFVTRAAGLEETPVVRGNMDKAAAHAGLHRVILKTIPDSNGRPSYEIFRFEK